MKNFKYIIFAFVAITITGCTNFDGVKANINPDEITVNSVKGSKFKMHIPVNLKNPTTKRLFIKKANIDILKNGYSFAKMKLTNIVEFPAQTEGIFYIVFDGKVVDPMGMMFTKLDVKKMKEENYTFNGYVKIGTKYFSKKIHVKNSNFDIFTQTQEPKNYHEK